MSSFSDHFIIRKFALTKSLAAFLLFAPPANTSKSHHVHDWQLWHHAECQNDEGISWNFPVCREKKNPGKIRKLHARYSNSRYCTRLTWRPGLNPCRWWPLPRTVDQSAARQDASRLRSWILAHARTRSVTACLRRTHEILSPSLSVYDVYACAAWSTAGDGRQRWLRQRRYSNVRNYFPSRTDRERPGLRGSSRTGLVDLVPFLSIVTRMKTHAVSHRACVSSSVRHDTTSLLFLSLFLTLPTPPPLSPFALHLPLIAILAGREDVGRTHSLVAAH